jgi:hypothetical protein
MAPLPPNVSPFTLVNAGRRDDVTVNDNGKILFFGNASDGRTGTWFLQFVPNLLFVGQFSVVARPYGSPASNDGVAMQDYPFRRVVLNGVASDRTITNNTATPLSGGFAIEVPSNGVALGLLVSCTAGGGVVYSWPLNGPAT